MNIRAIALALLLCLCLTACGGEPEESGGQMSLLETAAGLDGSEHLLTIDNREIPAWRYLYWLAYTCDQIAQSYTESEVTLDWAAPVSGGTLADYAKDQALADTALYATVENWAEKYGCVAEMEAQTPAALPDLGLGQEQMQELEQVGWLYTELYQLYHTADSALAPAAEDLRTYGQEQGAITLNRILVPMGEDRESASQRAAELFSQLNSAEDQTAKFSELTAGSADTLGPRTVLPGDDSLDASLLETAAALEEGQCSGIVESEEGFSILLRLPLDTAALMDRYFESLLASAAENSVVTTTQAYTDLDPAAFYDAWRQGRQGSGT